jgi:hypothetical protein
MSQRVRTGLTSAVAALALAGCAVSPTTGDGTTRAELGREVQIRSSGSPKLASLWLDSVKKVDCTEPGSLPPNRGVYLAVTIVLQTTEDYAPDWGWWMSALDFEVVDSGGKETGRGIITSCLAEHRYLDDDFYLRDAGYYGVVLLDAAAEHGTLVYRPHNMPALVGGWSWDF